MKGRVQRLNKAGLGFVWITGSVVILLMACTPQQGTNSAGETAASYQPGPASLAPRPDADIARDAGRKPNEVLAFLGVQPGMTALDVIAAGGYYTEVLAHAVGLEGRVYAQNPAVVLRMRNGANDQQLNRRLLGNRLPNVRRLDRELSDLGLVADSVDVAVTALNFHDVYNRDPKQAAAMLAIIKGLLKPGGVLGIIDHNGNAGADNAALHRMHVQDAITLAETAGFTVENSDILANPDDDRSQGPFTPGLRGFTDRFLLKLTKPSE